MSVTPKPKTPTELNKAGQEFWRLIAWVYPLRPDERKILGDACLAADIQAKREGDISVDSVRSLGSQGQGVINPSYTEWHQYSSIVADKKSGTDGSAVALALGWAAPGGVTVTTLGHPQMFGLGGDNALPGLWGQPTRSTNNPPDSNKAALDLMYPGAVTINNRASSGETAAGWLGFNAGIDHGDIEFLCLDQNEAVNSTSIADDVVNFQKVLQVIIDGASQSMEAPSRSSSAGTTCRTARGRNAGSPVRRSSVPWPRGMGLATWTLPSSFAHSRCPWTG